MIDMANLQREVVAWQKKTFPESTIESCIRHLADEFLELEQAVVDGEPQERIAEEVADMVLLLIAVCGKAEIELEHAVAWKFMNVRRRTYAFDPARGYSRHVEATDDR